MVEKYKQIGPDYLKLCAEEINNKDKAKSWCVGAAAFGAITSPLWYFAASNFKDARTFYNRGRHLSELAARSQSTAQQAPAKDNYNAAIKHGSIGLSYALFITLPLALLLRKCRQYFVAAKQARTEIESLEAKLRAKSEINDDGNGQSK